MPSGVYIHLASNHLPVVGTVFVFLLCLGALWRKGNDLSGAALCAMVLVALFAVPAYFSGEDAEDAVKGLPGVARDDIHEHEEAAEFAFVATEVLGAVGLAGVALLWRRRALPGWYLPAATIVALVVLVTMARTANLGGRIRHPEMHGAATAAPAGAGGEGVRDRD